MKNIYLIFSLFFISFHGIAQTNLVLQNFNASINQLPNGWTAPNGGWQADTSNASSGYAGASALTNLVIRNTNATGVYTLISAPFSALGYENISVLWSARLTVNFPVNGSEVQNLSVSTDAGNSWTNIPYTENTNNSVWQLNNNGNRISLPASVNNQPDVRLRWTVSIVNHTDGTYRIDDLNVQGTALATSVNNVLEPNLIETYCDESNTLHIKNLTGTIFDCLLLYSMEGKILHRGQVTSTVSLPNLTQGMYVLKLQSGNKYLVKKLQR